MRRQMTSAIALAALFAGSVALQAQDRGGAGGQGGAAGPAQGQAGGTVQQQPGGGAGGAMQGQTGGASQGQMRGEGRGEPGLHGAQQQQQTQQPGAREERQAQQAQQQEREGKTGQQREAREGQQGQQPQGQRQAQGEAAKGDKKQVIRRTIESGNVKRYERNEIDFNISVGTAVPRTLALAPLPPAIVEVYPAYEGFRYIVVGNTVVIINPATYEIVV